MNFRVLALLLAFIAIILPQLVLSIPFAPSNVRSTDLIALLAVPAAIFGCRYGGYSRRVTTIMVAAVGFALCVSMLRMLLDHQQHTYVEESAQLARLFSIHAPILLVAALPKDRKLFSNSLLVFGCVAVLASLVIATLYHFGSTAFDAHQTFRRGGGDLSHRLGGLQGETGAFAFNAVIGFQALMVGLAMMQKKRIFWIAFWIAMPLYLGFIYHESLVRISILTSGLFAAVTLIGVNHSAKSKRFVVLCFVLLFCMMIPLLSAAGIPIAQLEVDRLSVDAGLNSSSLNRLSSGRVDHWIAGAEQALENPTYALFGMGYRAPDFVLGHPIENFFVFHLATYGLIGSALFIAMYVLLAWPIVREAMRGDFACGVYTAMLLAVFVQWQVNDVNLYFQTFPVLLLMTGWYSAICVEQRASATVSETVTKPSMMVPHQSDQSSPGAASPLPT